MSAATVTAVAAVASVGVGAAAAAGAFAPGSPSQASYGETLKQSIQDQIDMLPTTYAASQQWDPQFAALQNQMSYQDLFGTPAGTRSVSTPTSGFRNTITGQFVAGDTNPGANGQGVPSWGQSGQGGDYPVLGINGFESGDMTSQWVPYTQYNDTTVPTAATPGLIQIAAEAQPGLTAIQTAANTQTRAADIADVQNLGPEALTAMRSFNPQATALEDSLAGEAQQELNAGYSLTPQEQRLVQQNIRASQAARGMGTGPSDALQESEALSMQGESLRQQRQNFASGVVGQQQALYGDPFMQILGRSSGATPTPSSVLNPYPSAVGSAISSIGSTPYNMAMFNTGAQNQASIAGYNSQMAGLGALMSNPTAMGSLFGSLSKVFGGANSGTLYPGGTSDPTLQMMQYGGM